MLLQRSVVAICIVADKPYATSDNAYATARDPSRRSVLHQPRQGLLFLRDLSYS
jgi:hypothetical protein